MGTKAYVCQVCSLYAQTTQNISDLYEESRKIAEKKIKEKELELEDFALDGIKEEDEVDLTIDEFDEEEKVIPLKFEKRKAGKGGLEDGEEGYGEIICPFCDELVDNLQSHILECEFAPEDASIADLMPAKLKKRKKRKPRATTSKAATSEKAPQEKQKCPYCGKEFLRLGRHLNSCKKKPKDVEASKDES